MKNKINLEGAYNFRDIGGYKSSNGKRIKKNVLFRSDELSKLTKKDIASLTELNIHTIIDYRNQEECLDNEDVEIPNAQIIKLTPIADIAALASSNQQDKLKIESAEMTAKMANFLMTEQNKAFVTDPTCKKVYQEMFKIMLQPSNLGIVQHCRGGKDRTGYGVALILGLFGVPDEIIMQDYLLTNEYKKEKNEKSLKELYEKTKNDDLVAAFRAFKEANEEFLNEAISIIHKEYGGFRSYIQNELKITAEEIKRLEQIYLEED